MGKTGYDRMKPGDPPPPVYRVFEPMNQEQDDGRDYVAWDVMAAARLYADFYYHHRDGYELTWPVTFRVIDTSSGKNYDVSVDLDMSPSFSSAEPKELPCNDPVTPRGGTP